MSDSSAALSPRPREAVLDVEAGRVVHIAGSEPRRPQNVTLADESQISSRDMGLAQPDYEHLLELRTGLRRFLGWSEQQARKAGLTPAKHQLLLAIQGHPDPAGPTIGQLADYLVLRHHSVVGLVDRAERDGLVKRQPDATNKSVVRVTLTPTGGAKLDALTEAHLQEIRHLAPTMRALWRALGDGDSLEGATRGGKVSRAATPARQPPSARLATRRGRQGDRDIRTRQR
jgi:DNA-binding MarR family transcriptional regulator